MCVCVYYCRRLRSLAALLGFSLCEFGKRRGCEKYEQLFGVLCSGIRDADNFIKGKNDVE